MSKRGHFNYYPYYNYNPHPAYYRAARDDKRIGWFPQEEINRKFNFDEQRSHEEINRELQDLENYQREVLKDLGPDPRFAEVDTKQEATGNLSRMRINVREYGTRYDKEPEHPEIFLGFVGQDPGGPILNTYGMVKQAWDRRDIVESQLSSDADNSLPSGGNLSKYGVEIQKKQVYRNWRDRNRIFTTAKDGRITGLPYFGPPQAVSLKGKSCQEVGTPTDQIVCDTINNDKATVKLSNHVLSGNPIKNNYIPDHEFRVGPYGESMRRSHPLNDPAHNAARIKTDIMSTGFNDIGAKKQAIKEIAAYLNRDFTVLDSQLNESNMNIDFKNKMLDENVKSNVERIILDSILKNADLNVNYKKGAICENLEGSKLDKINTNHIGGYSEENEIFKSMYIKPKLESTMGRTEETALKQTAPEKYTVYKNGKYYEVSSGLMRLVDNIIYGNENGILNGKNGKLYSDADRNNMISHNTIFNKSHNSVNVKNNYTRPDSHQTHQYNDDTKFYDNYYKDRRVAHNERKRQNIKLNTHGTLEGLNETQHEFESTLI